MRVTTEKFPNLALAAVQAGNAVESNIYNKTRALIEEAKGYQKQIKELLEWKKTLSQRGEGSSLSKVEQSQLENLNVAIGSYDRMSKEQISNLREMIDHQIEQNKSEAEIRYTVQISPMQQNLQTIWSALQGIISDHRRLLDKISERGR